MPADYHRGEESQRPRQAGVCRLERDAALRGATLTDDQGKTYPAKPVNVAAVLGTPPPSSIAPGESARDVLCFELPGPKAQIVATGVAGRGLRKRRLGQFPNPRQDDCRQAGGGEVGAQGADRNRSSIASPSRARPNTISGSGKAMTYTADTWIIYHKDSKAQRR